MKLCDKCFSMLEPKATFCGECGGPVGEDISQEGSDAVVYPEIARANLFRMRGEMAEAERICLAILKRFPNNPSTHVLLGDINNENGNLDQAKQWYEMSLDLTPDNRGVIRKLQLLNDELALRQEAQATAGLEVKPAARGLIAIYASAFVFLVIVVFLAFWLGGARARALHDKRTDVIEPISVNGTAPKSLPNSQSKPPAAAPAGAPGPSQPAPAPPLPMTSTESGLLASAASELGAAGGRLSLVTIDSKTSTAFATLLGDAGAATAKDAIEAAQTASAIIRKSQAPPISRVDVRVLDTATHQVRFSASATPDSLAAGTALKVGTLEWAAAVLLDANPSLK